MRKTPGVLGVLSMVFGGIQAAFSALTMVSQPFSKGMMTDFSKAFSGLPQQEGQPDTGKMFADLARVTEELKPYNYAIHGVMVALSIALIVIGYLLFKRRPQSRPLSLGWAAVALASLPVQSYVQIKIIQPKTTEVMAQMFAGTGADSLMQGLSGMTSVAAVVIQMLLYVPYPVVLLILMGRPSAKNDLVAG